MKNSLVNWGLRTSSHFTHLHNNFSRADWGLSSTNESQHAVCLGGYSGFSNYIFDCSTKQKNLVPLDLRSGLAKDVVRCWLFLGRKTYFAVHYWLNAYYVETPHSIATSDFYDQAALISKLATKSCFKCFIFKRVLNLCNLHLNTLGRLLKSLHRNFLWHNKH